MYQHLGLFTWKKKKQLLKKVYSNAEKKMCRNSEERVAEREEEKKNEALELPTLEERRLRWVR